MHHCERGFCRLSRFAFRLDTAVPRSLDGLRRRAAKAATEALRALFPSGFGVEREHGANAPQAHVGPYGHPVRSRHRQISTQGLFGFLINDRQYGFIVSLRGRNVAFRSKDEPIRPNLPDGN